MTWKERLLGLPLAALGAVLLLGTGAVATLTRTDLGRERLRGLAVEELNRRLSGHVEIDAFIEGDLLRRVRLAGVRIDQHDGERFASIDTLDLEYSWADLLIGDIAFSRVTLVGPVIQFSVSPEGKWNFEEIFGSGGEASTTSSGSAASTKESREIVLRQLAMRSGELSLHMPWADEGAAPETSLWQIEEAQGRLERVFRIKRLNATLPIARIAAPKDVGRLLQIAQFTGLVGVYREPIDIEQLRADVEFRGDTIAFDVWEAILPESRLFGKGLVTLGDEVGYDVSLHGAPVNSRDLLWLEPRLPAGVAQLDFRLRNLPGGLAVEAANAEWESEEAKVAGRFAMKLRDGPDRLEFDRVELAIERFSTSLISPLTGWEPPVAGEISGLLDLDGQLSELDLYADLRFRPDAEERHAHVLAEGTVFAGREKFGASAVQVTVDTLPLDLVRAFVPGLAVDGQLAGDLRLEGRLEEGLAVYFEIEQRDRKLPATRLRGGGRIWSEPGSKPRVDLAALTDPLSLTTLSEYYPAIPFRGDLDGRVSAKGVLDRLEVEADLAGAGDSISVRGEVRLAADGPQYRGEIRGWRTKLAPFRRGLGNSDLDFRIDLAGRGGKVEAVDARGHIEVYSSFVSDVQVDTGYADLRVVDGRLHVDTAVLRAEFGELRAGGALGLVHGAVDSLSFDLEADSIGGLNRWLWPGFEPLAERVLAANGAGSAGVLAQRARIEGYARASGHISGGFIDPVVSASVEGRGLSYGTLAAERLRITEFEAGGFGSSPALRGKMQASGTAIGDVQIGELKLVGQFIDRVATAEFEAVTEGTAGASGRVWARIESEARTLGLDDLTLNIGGSTWRLARPTRIRLADSGAISVEGLKVESSDGRVELDGAIGVTGPVSMTADVEGVDLAEVATLWPDSVGIAGVLALHAELAGRTRSPLAKGHLEVVDGHVLGVSFSALRGTLDYRDGNLSVDAGMWVDTAQLFRLHGALPLDLTLPGLQVDLPDRGMQLAFEGDRIPLSLTSILTDQIADPSGHARANVLIRGSPKDVSLQGRAHLVGGGVHVVSTGVTYRGLVGELLFRGARIELSDVTFEGSTGGRGQLSGFIDVANLRRPVFDLALEAEDLPAYAQPDARGAISGSMRLSGPYTEAVVEGDVSVVGGELFIEEIGRRREIINPFTEDFELIDDIFAVEEGGERRTGQSAFLENLRLNLNVSVQRDTWVREICAFRSRTGCTADQASVAIGGDLTVRGQPWQDSLRIDGTLGAIRGDYKLFNRRFEVAEGTLEFVGTPGLNPNIRIIATHLVQTQKRPIEIRVVLAGTLEQPKLALESDAQPPINESDLLSYLLFGRPTYEITKTGGEEGSLLEGVASGVPQTVFGYALESLLAGGTGIDYVEVSRAPLATADTRYNSGLAPAIAATQVEVGWYLAPTVFVSIGQQLVGAVRPTVRVEWRLAKNLTVRGVTEPRFAREATLYSETADLAQTYGLFLFYGWSY